MARDNRIDSLKGFLIILVILGHVITTLDNVNPLNHAVMGLIYVFHMPLFILISGYMTKRPEQQTAREVWRGAINLLITFLIFQVLNCLSVTVLGANFTRAMRYFPYGVLWYLPSLAFWRLMLYYTPKGLLDRPWIYLSLALVASMLSGLTYLGNDFAIQRTLNFYLFFLLGYYYRQNRLPAAWWHNNILHAGLAVVLLPLILWLYPHCGNVMNGADHYELSDMMQKGLILTCSVVMSLLVFNLWRDNKVLRHIGKDSMFYYLYHSFIFDTGLAIIIRHGWPVSLPFNLLYTAVIVAILFLLSKIDLLRWAIQPMLKKKG